MLSQGYTPNCSVELYFTDISSEHTYGLHSPATQSNENQFIIAIVKGGDFNVSQEDYGPQL